MSDKENKNKELAKKLVNINYEDRRQMQYMMMKEWDAGIITGMEAIQAIVDMEKVVTIDIHTLRKARAGQLQRKK